MKIGRLRHRVPIYKLIQTQNEFNELVFTKELLGTFSCRVEYTDNGTDEVDDVAQNFKKITLHTRFSRTFGKVDNDMVAEFDGRDWDVKGVINRDFRNRELMIYCELRGVN